MKNESMKFGRHILDLAVPHVMGILNVTPDSFFDGGQLYKGNRLQLSDVLSRAGDMVKQGASFIDVGGESTRPGAQPISLQEEMDRVLPVVEALASSLDTVISVDTSSPEVMGEAVNLGAGFINDVRALEREGALEAAAKTAVPICLMHMRGSPQTMQDSPEYTSVVQTVREYFDDRMVQCEKAGIDKSRVILDPGIGFGKTDDHNVELIRELAVFSNVCPVLMGVSRKSLIGRLLGRELDERLAGSLAFAYASLIGGARILRVHDVSQTTDIVKVFKLLNLRN